MFKYNMFGLIYLYLITNTFLKHDLRCKHLHYFYFLGTSVLLMVTSLFINIVKGVVCSTHPIHFLSNSANVSSRSASCPFCACAEKKNLVFTHSPGSVNGKQTDGLRASHTTCAQDNSLDTCQFDRGIICVYSEYVPLHLSLSPSINIHCI